jgi:hypothetical protein
MLSFTDLWLQFFKDAGVPSNVAVKYALTFVENRIKKYMLLDLNKEYLKEMGITLMGDIISILKHARDVYEEVRKFIQYTVLVLLRCIHNDVKIYVT